MNKKTIILIYPFHRYWVTERPWLPLSSIFLASTLLNAGYKVIIVDDRFSREETLEKITKHITNTILVGITTISGSQLKNTIDIVKWIREKYNVPIVLGGKFPSAEPEMCLRELPINYVISGQGEHNLLKLADFLNGKGNKEQIANLYWRGSQGFIYKSPQKPERVDINTLPPLPFFNKEVISLEKYIHPENRIINYQISTGCFNRCTFCCWPTPTYKFSFFDNDRVIKNLKELKKRYDIKVIDFQEPVFFVDLNRIRDLVNKIIKAQLNISWRCNTRVDNLHKCTKEDIGLFKKSGCCYIYLGLESGSPDMLRIMNKRINLQDAVSSIVLVKQAGIKILTYFLFGMPGETIKHLQETADFMHRLLKIDSSIELSYAFFTPFPGAEATKAAESYPSYSKPTSIYEYSQLDLPKTFPPRNNRDPYILKSPWENEIDLPWFSKEFYKKYMDYFRKNIPKPRILTGIDGKEKKQYAK